MLTLAVSWLPGDGNVGCESANGAFLRAAQESSDIPRVGVVRQHGV
ncbi:MAG: hypothetical protein ACRD4X_05745 [Candidatus Acidiferrales bacterium]